MAKDLCVERLRFPCQYLNILPVAQYVRGMYAVRLKGQLPEDVENILREQNIKYRPRDQTIMD